jgi:hypothetical protein
MLTFTGCATLTTGTNQSVTVDTEKDVYDASCKLTDKKDRSWHLRTPGTVMVRKGDGPMTILCEKEGYKPSQLVVEETITAATFGNIILGGAVGVVVDAATGAAQKYPANIIVWMEPEKWASEEDKTAWLMAKGDLPMKGKEGKALLEKKEREALIEDRLQKCIAEIGCDRETIAAELDKEKAERMANLPEDERPPSKDDSPQIETVASASTTKPEDTPSGSAVYKTNQPSLFDGKTGLTWTVVPSKIVDYGTAVSFCKSLKTEHIKECRVPSLQEFEQLWTRYKDDERISVFNKKAYTVKDESPYADYGLSQSFSFESGTTENGYTASLVCVEE